MRHSDVVSVAGAESDGHCKPFTCFVIFCGGPAGLAATISYNSCYSYVYLADSALACLQVDVF